MVDEIAEESVEGISPRAEPAEGVEDLSFFVDEFDLPEARVALAFLLEDVVDALERRRSAVVVVGVTLLNPVREGLKGVRRIFTGALLVRDLTQKLRQRGGAAERADAEQVVEPVKDGGEVFVGVGDHVEKSFNWENGVMLPFSSAPSTR